MTYHVGIDLGTTFTTAAVRDAVGTRMVGLAHDRVAIPSVVAPVDDRYLVGDEAAAVSATAPWNVAREFKRRFGDPTPMYINGEVHTPEELTGRLLRWVLDRVQELEGQTAESITVTHPATWGTYKLELLRAAATAVSIPDIRLIAEPTAAAIHYHSRERVADGSTIAVYDLGGGTFDVTLLKRNAESFDIRAAGGLERAGGLDLDDAVLRLVIEAVESHFEELDTEDLEAQRAVARLREECTRAKIGLSYDTRVVVPVVLPGLVTDVLVQRSEFEELVSPLIGDTIAATEAAIERADLKTPLSSVLLVGGSSRVPVITQRLAKALGVPVVVDTHPKHAVALGAVAAHHNSGQAAPDGVDAPRQSFFGLQVPAEAQELPETTVQVPMGTRVLDRDQRLVVILTGPLGGRAAELPNGRTVMGRTDGNGIWGLASRLVSRSHVEFERNGRQVTVRDLNSTNGTWVDGRTVGATSVTLEPGMIIDVAGTLVMLDGSDALLESAASIVASWSMPSPPEVSVKRRKRRSTAGDWLSLVEGNSAVLGDTATRLRRSRRFERPSAAVLKLWTGHLPDRLVRPHVPIGTVVLGWATQPSLLDLEIPDFVTGNVRDDAAAIIDPSTLDPLVPFVVPLLGETTVVHHRGPETETIARSIASELTQSGEGLRIEIKFDERASTKEILLETDTSPGVPAMQGRVLFDPAPNAKIRSSASVTIEEQRASYRNAAGTTLFYPATLIDESDTGWLT